jgi:GDP-mannose pyrophosphatase nudK
LKSDSIKPKELSLDEGEEIVVEWINVKDIVEKSNDMKTLFGVTYFSK